jgi:hypothetical protein
MYVAVAQCRRELRRFSAYSHAAWLPAERYTLPAFVDSQHGSPPRRPRYRTSPKPGPADAGVDLCENPTRNE